MPNIKGSITTKLLILFLFTGIVSVLVVGSYAFYSARRALINRTLDQLISVRAVKKQQVEYYFTEKFRNLEDLSRNEHLIEVMTNSDQNHPGSVKSQSFEFLKGYYSAYGFSNLYLVRFSDTGDMVTRSVDSTGQPLPQCLTNQIIKIANSSFAQKGCALSDLFLKAEQDSMSCCLIGHKVKADNGTVLGIVILEIGSKEINRIMLQDNREIGLGNSGETYLIGQDFLMRSRSRFIRNSVMRIEARTDATENALAGNAGTTITDDYRGIKVFSAYEPIKVPGLHWVVIAEIDFEEAMVPVTSLRNDILLVSVIISILILGFARVITNMITQPLINLKNAAIRLGKGDYHHEVRVDSGDEIGMLAATFNTMSTRIREEQKNRLQALYDGQEMERRRISRELHDGLGQKLVGAKLLLENCNESDISCLQKTADETKDRLHSIVEELRRISNDLMPVSLDELGLETSLRNLCRDVERQTKLEVDFDISTDRIIKGKIAVYLYRIAQEGLQNILRHSAATRVSLQLIQTRDSLIFMLEDNGKGFDPESVIMGNGLSNMKERTNLLGGIWSVESVPGSGTTIRCKIPVISSNY